MTKIYSPLTDIDSVIPILSRISVWGGLSGEQQEKIYKRIEVGTFEKGEHVFRKGDEPSHIYIVKKGKIEIQTSDEAAIVQKETIETGGSFGVAALMAVQTHMATAVAAEDTELMVLSKQALHGLYHDDVKLFALLVMNIAREIARRLKMTDDILLKYVREHQNGSR